MLKFRSFKITLLCKSRNYIFYHRSQLYTRSPQGQQLCLTPDISETDYWYHVKYDCILYRFPYFWTGYFAVDESNLRALEKKPQYNAQMLQEFGVALADVKHGLL